MIDLEPPYLLFLGDADGRGYAKTARGIAHWRPDQCTGQIRLDRETDDVGLPDMTIAEAVAADAKTFVIGVAPAGGRIKPHWTALLVEAAEAGLHVAAGLHDRLTRLSPLATAAERAGVRLIDVREPPHPLQVGTGVKRQGKRLLTVGTDCSVGKMFTTLSLEQEMRARGHKATFRATGQTGIFIAGAGVPVDALPADFISGMVEALSPDTGSDHWDLIEGQGSLFHPSFAGVSLGLLHGAQADAIVLCHKANRAHILGLPTTDYPVPSLEDCMALNLELGRLTNPAIRCLGVSVNTSDLPEAERRSYLASLEDRLGLPCVDPVATGPAPLVDALEAWQEAWRP